MAFPKMKRVSDPLDDRAKARIFGGYSSSGSEYSAQADDDAITSTSLDDLFFGFTVNDNNEKYRVDNADSSEHTYESNDEINVDFVKQILVDNHHDSFQNVLKDHVLKGLQIYSCLKSNKPVLRRNVMSYLRDCGYNAAICKSKWEKCGGLTAGNFEFIDVIRHENSVRYFVDLDFASEFEIARPTSGYEKLMEHIPSVFVGESEELKGILRTVSDGVKRSLKNRGLLLPPWRKYRYMQNKWFGSYKRTTNIYTVSFCENQNYCGGAAVCCRAVGFDATIGGQRSFSNMTRTR